MKNASTALIAHIGQPLTTLTTCLKITRTDDVVLAFTALDQPFTFESVLHKIGYDPTAVVSSDAMNVDNLEWQGVVDHEDITSDDIRAGKYDDAAFEIYRVNWADLTQGKIILKTGTIGNISLNYPGEFVAEGRSLMQSLQVKIGMHFTPHCKWDLGDHRCKFKLVGQIGDVGEEELPDPAIAIPFWQANHAYVVGDLVSPTVPNGFSYICIDPGTSGATEPDWDAAETDSEAGTQSYLTDSGVTDNKAYIVTPAETGQYVLQGPVGEVGSGRWAFLQDGIGNTHQIAHTTQTGSIPNDGAWTTNNDIHSASITASVSGGKTSYQLALSTVDDAVYACGEVDLLLLAVTSLPVPPGATQITLTWEDAAADETGFKIERSLNVNTGYVEIATVGANVLTYLDTGLQAGTTYYYRVRSTNAAGDSTYSNTASHTTDAALQINEPGVLSFSQQAFIGALTSLTLTWKSGVNSASHGTRCMGGLDAAIAMISVYFKNTTTDETLQYQIYTYDSRGFAPDTFWFNSTGPFYGVADNITRYGGVYSPLGAAPQSFTAEILARVIALMAACPNPALDEDPDHWKILMMSVGPFVNGEAIINCTVSDVGMVAGTATAPVPGIIDGGVIWEKSAPTPPPPGPPVPPPVPPGPDAPAPGSYVTPATVATVIDPIWEFTATTTGTQLQLNSTVPVPYWQSKHMYWVGDSVRPTDTDITLRAVCNALVWDEKKKTQDVPSGTSDDDEPDWPEEVGERIEDNELEWVMVEDQWYKDGVLRFTSGDNAGLAKQFEVLLYEVTGTSARFRLVLPTPYPIQVGDTFLVEAGCDKSHMTCIYKFNNILNFGGEPHVAGFNRPHDTPTDSSLE